MRKVLFALFLLLSACHQRMSAPAHRYEIKGKVVSVDRSRGQVTLAHEAIPGYMPAMTMPFTVKDSWAMSILAPGQLVQAELLVDDHRSWLEQIIITETPKTSGQAAVESTPEPKPGDEIPDFHLTDQDGKHIHLGQFRGSVLLLTFIYTRCPLPDYCPLMSRNFAEIYKEARADPSLKLHLLSVSFDPEFDRPEVLRAYGISYTGSRSAFGQWEFASGSAEEIKSIAGFFGLEYWKETGQWVHSLRTALISPQGRLIRIYRGNDWTPQQVLAEMRRPAVE